MIHNEIKRKMRQLRIIIIAFLFGLVILSLPNEAEAQSKRRKTGKAYSTKMKPLPGLKYQKRKGPSRLGRVFGARKAAKAKRSRWMIKYIALMGLVGLYFFGMFPGNHKAETESLRKPVVRVLLIAVIGALALSL